MIRSEFKARGDFESDFVDSLLKWANGLSGKTDKLILPLWKHDAQKYKELQGFCTLAKEINDERNKIAHRGIFCTETKAKKLIEKCKICVEGLVRPYNTDFVLRESKDVE
ncbi:hypothetical protein [Ralstonia mannitolilytica]|uniref:hypothetical protein n=1 Tax=Ralstonia mannitolilytica TaxID=105219 RepID=UPI0015F05F4B|nr:hypothetical protein [Ralstonia mannitolilytica]